MPDQDVSTFKNKYYYVIDYIDLKTLHILAEFSCQESAKEYAQRIVMQHPSANIHIIKDVAHVSAKPVYEISYREYE